MIDMIFRHLANRQFDVGRIAHNFGNRSGRRALRVHVDGRLLSNVRAGERRSGPSPLQQSFSLHLCFPHLRAKTLAHLEWRLRLAHACLWLMGVGSVVDRALISWLLPVALLERIAAGI